MNGEMEKCVFCGRLRELGVSKRWTSGIKIVLVESKSVLYEATVCPQCRGRKTINDLYQAVMNARLKSLKKMRKGSI